MDQTTPSYSGTGLERSTFGGLDRDNFDYFPYGGSFSETDFYNVPNQSNHFSNFPQYSNQLNSIPPRIFPESPPESYPNRFVSQAGLQGSPSYSSSSGTPPSSATLTVPFQQQKSPHLLSPYDIAGSPSKRIRGSSASYDDHSSSPRSLLSCKQEDELNFVPFPQTEAGAQFLPGQFYQESSTPSVFEDGHRTIEFKPVFQEQWCSAVDSSGRPTIFTDFKVQADKGFNHSQVDDAFICQKKNHFQVTLQVTLVGVPDFVQITPGTTGPTYHKINGYYIELFGVKSEAQQLSNKIKIEQSQSDRSRKEFLPHYISPANLQKQTIVGRLHFSETTANNMRKKGKPNPDQRFFRLVVGLYAECTNQQTGQSFRQLMYASASENIIVRASNPGQFESDAQPGPAWQRGTQDEDAIFHVGRIGINTEKPTEALDVRGNVNVSGRINQPSDARAKDILGGVDNMQQLENIRNLTLYRYKYKDDVCKTLQLSGAAQFDTGILAQDLLETIPEAVEFVGDLELENGETIENFLMVNKDRLFMEGVGAVQALCSVTDNLGNTIVTIEDRLNKIRRVLKLKRGDSVRSNFSSITGKSINSGATTCTAGHFASSSARPSVYSITSIPLKELEGKPSLRKKPTTFLEKHQLLQWFILAFVTIVSISLIALVAVFVISNEQKTHAEATLPSVIVNRDLNVSFVPSIQHSTSPAPVGMTRILPHVITGDHDVWLAHFTADVCNASPLIASNQQCLTNDTYAQTKCRTWPHLECCSDKLSRPVARSLPVPEAAHFPEYQSGNQYNFNRRDLKISFGEGYAKGYPSSSRNLVSKEMSDGQAVVYTMPVDAEVVKDLLESLPQPQVSCNQTTRSDDSEDEDHKHRWGPLMHKIVLIEPNIVVDREYCFSKNGSEDCGHDNTFIITLPLSKYYAESNLTVLFEGEPATSLVTCGYRILGDGCYHRLSTAYHQEIHDNVDAFTVPVGNHAHSELTVAIVPATSFRKFDTDICDQKSPDIFTFKLLFGRTCN